MSCKSFEELDVWKRATGLAVLVYKVMKNCRDYGMKDQMTRAAVSIASNIAEGAERDSKTEYISFIHIAQGSAAELRTQVYIAQNIGLLPKTQAAELSNELKEISSMLQGLPNPLNLTLKT